MHSDIDTLERIEIVGGLRGGDFDVLVGIKPAARRVGSSEVRLVAILDADKEGFLRSETALIQTVGRAARNAEGRVVMYADTVTDSMRRAIDETARRRRIQDEYNKAHGIVPRTVEREFKNTLEITKKKVDRDICRLKTPCSGSRARERAHAGCGGTAGFRGGDQAPRRAERDKEADKKTEMSPAFSFDGGRKVSYHIPAAKPPRACASRKGYVCWEADRMIS